jgi:predicted kinase
LSNKLIIITGYLASGKTTFSLNLAKLLGIPCFNKDRIKSVIGKEIIMTNREESKKYSRVTFDIMMHIANELMACGYNFIIEGNFGNENSMRINELLKKYKYEALTFLFIGDLKVLHERFVKRDNSTERDNANKINGLLDNFLDFEKVVKPLGEFGLGNPIIKMDGTDFSKINYENYITIASNYIDERHEDKF